MKRILLPRLALLLLLVGALLPLSAQRARRPHVLLHTTMGDVEVELFSDLAPRHCANFLKLVESHFYDGTLFHRVIADFMVQAGDPDSKTAVVNQKLGDGDLPYKQDAEFALPHAYHHRGALAAAREPDADNPQRQSSACQFYIVWGRTFLPEELAPIAQQVDRRVGREGCITPAMAADYEERGGAPHLDGQYTVFGEVVKGLKVIGKMQQEPTDSNDRPIEDIRILTATVVE